MQPPRALIVPFELGRPLGAPENPDFQHQVLEATFALLDNPDTGPHFVEFSDAAPSAANADKPLEGWSCPVNFNHQSDAPPPAVLSEIAALQPWYQKALQHRGRTSADTSGLAIEDAAQLLLDTAAGQAPASQADQTIGVADLVKLAAEDLKLFYAEAAMEQPDPGSSRELQDWFWNDTQAGKLLFDIADNCADHEDKVLRAHAKFTIVPAERLAQHQANTAP